MNWDMQQILGNLAEAQRDLNGFRRIMTVEEREEYHRRQAIEAEGRINARKYCP